MAKTLSDLEGLRKVLHYDPDTGLFTWTVKVKHGAVGSVAGCLTTTGYWQLRYQQREFKAHRAAWAFVVGEWPRGVMDHINGDRRDNRFANLRDVDALTNSQNRRTASLNNRSTGLLGVSVNPSSGKCQARISIAGKSKFLGEFIDPVQAYEAYRAAKRELHEGCTL